MSAIPEPVPNMPPRLWSDDSGDRGIGASSQWTAGLVFEAFGETIGLRTNSPAVMERMVEVLPPCRQTVEDPRVEVLFSLWVAPAVGKAASRDHVLYRNQTTLAKGKDLSDLLERLEDRLRLEIAYWADDDYVFVHAGVAGIDGKAVLIPGRSGAGKSTLVAALLESGADYYSDDMAVIDPDGRVLPYPTPLSLWEGSDRKSAHKIPPAQTGKKPIEIGLVLVTKFDAESRRWQPRRLSAARTIMALFDNTVAAQRLPKQAIQRFNMATADAQGYKARRGEAAEIVDWIHRQIN